MEIECPHIVATTQKEEIAMSATTHSNPVQRAVCMLLAAFIVSTGLATGALGMQLAERNASAVVVTQIA
jgi:hypothetical protein